MKQKFNMDYAPDRYWDTPEAVFANIKGSWRRKAIREAVETGEIDEVPEHILDDSLDDNVRRFAGQIHPSMMGGEYLPDYLPGEVEIARVELMSTTGDVFSIRARPVGRMIGYRVVDDYMDDPDRSPFCVKYRRSRTPLTMRQLAALINSSYAWKDYKGLGLAFGPLELNYGASCDDETLRNFVSVQSEFYPELWRYFDHRIACWFSRVVNGGLPGVDFCAQIAQERAKGQPCRVIRCPRL